MLKKIIKGSKKYSKSDSMVKDFGSRPPSFGNFGLDSMPNVVVNHASRPGQSAPNTNSSSSTIPFPPPMTTVEPLSLLQDAPVSERQYIFLRKLQICCFQFDFIDVLKSA
ncbi:hypothetical protein V6N13_122723 [Hibiscus sabdariffa]